MMSEIIVAVIAALGGLSRLRHRYGQVVPPGKLPDRSAGKEGRCLRKIQGSPLWIGRKSGSVAGTGTHAEYRDREDREVGRRRSGNRKKWKAMNKFTVST